MKISELITHANEASQAFGDLDVALVLDDDQGVAGETELQVCVVRLENNRHVLAFVLSDLESGHEHMQ